MTVTTADDYVLARSCPLGRVLPAAYIVTCCYRIGSTRVRNEYMYASSCARAWEWVRSGSGSGCGLEWEWVSEGYRNWSGYGSVCVHGAECVRHKLTHTDSVRRTLCVYANVRYIMMMVAFVIYLFYF